MKTTTTTALPRLPACLLLAGIVMLTSNPSRAENDPAYYHDSNLPVSNSSWMSRLPDNRSIKDISFPGTHDTMALYGGDIAECQSMPLDQQLRAGIRALDIRCRLFQDSFSIHHGLVYQNANFNDVLKTVGDFLRENPRETIVMRVKQEYASLNLPEWTKSAFKVVVIAGQFAQGKANSGVDAIVDWNNPQTTIPHGSDNAQSTKSFDTVFMEYFNAHKDLFWVPPPPKVTNVALPTPQAQGAIGQMLPKFQSTSVEFEIPTLGQVRGKIILLQDFKSDDGSYRGLTWNYFDIQDNYELKSIGSLYDKWLAVKGQLDQANGRAVTHYVLPDVMQLFEPGVTMTPQEWMQNRKSIPGRPNKMFINFLSGSSNTNIVLPYFVAGGRSDPRTDAPRLSTGISGISNDSKYPDFPRVNGFIYYTGTNILARDWIAKNNPGYLGIVYADFPGRDLINGIINTNK